MGEEEVRGRESRGDAERDDTGCPIKISSIITSHPFASNLLARAFSALSNTYTLYVPDDKKIGLCPCGIEKHFYTRMN
jgi:hypothetical protein